MLEVYKTMATKSEASVKYTQIDLDLFKLLKEIITQLLVVKPEKRMKLQDARDKLKELDQFTKTIDFNYMLLNSFIPQSEDDPTLSNIDETNNAMILMNEIRSTRLFTIPTTGDDKKLTQRLTNLCVSVSAMRLLSYALVEFLEKTFTGDRKTLKYLTDKILKYSENPTQVEREPRFIRKLITICCGVISPRSLNGLNHGHLDDDFQIAAQEQNIR